MGRSGSPEGFPLYQCEARRAAAARCILWQIHYLLLMTEVVLVALITAASTLLASYLAYLGSFRREEHARKSARDDALAVRRFERAEEFVDAVAQAAQDPAAEPKRWAVSVARAGFLSTLRPGEERAGWLTNRIVAVVLDSATPNRRGLLDDHVDILFRWLRGEVSVSELEVPPAHWGEAILADVPGAQKAADYRRAKPQP